MRTLVVSLAFGSAAVACGARSDVLDAVSAGASPRDASIDARRDATTADASPPPDSATDAAGPDAFVEAARATDAADVTDASDARLAPDAGCDFTGEPAGTVQTLVTLGDGGIEDFDVDCAGVVFTTSQGEILSCPTAGCGAAPSVVAPPGSYVPVDFQVRIGSDTLFVSSESTPSVDAGDGRLLRSDVLFTQARQGGTPTVILSLPSSTVFSNPPGAQPASCSVTGFGTTGPAAAFEVSCDGPYGIDGAWKLGSFDVVTPAPGGGATVTELPSPWIDGAFAQADGAGGAYYTFAPLSQAPMPGLPGPPFDFTIDRYPLNGGPGSRTVFASVSAPTDKFVLFASTTFVLWAAQGGGSTYACQAGATCTAPVLVPGLDQGLAGEPHLWPLVATDDALIVGGSGASTTSWDLLTCPAADVLSGACTPTVLAKGLPFGFGRVVATRAHVYLQTPAGILRIAR